MNCPDKEALSAYLDRQASPAEARDILAHLEKCGACGSRLKVMKAMKAAVASAVDVPPMPEDLRRALEGLAPHREPGWRRFLDELAAGWRRPAAAAALSLAAVLVMVWAARRSADRQRELPVEMLLAAHDQYALTVPLAAEERIVSETPPEEDWTEGPDEG